jgi:hypothetical protein
MKEVDTLVQYMRFMVPLESQPLSCVQPSETALQFQQSLSIHQKSPRSGEVRTCQGHQAPENEPGSLTQVISGYGAVCRHLTVTPPDRIVMGPARTRKPPRAMVVP